MDVHDEAPWRPLAAAQAGVVSREQLRDLGVDRWRIRNQLRAGRWQEASSTVVVTTTGELTTEQRHWVGILHAGRPGAVGGLTALAVAGLAGWSRPEPTIVVPKSESPPRMPGYAFVETRRDLPAMVAASSPPRLLVEPAALLFAAYVRSERTGCALLAAVVQQRLTSVPRLSVQLTRMRPLRRAPLFRTVLDDIAGGAHSLAEIDLGRVCDRFGIARPARQTPRRDRHGRRRWTDAEWELPDGRVLVLEVDGAFHMDVDNWWQDMSRERELVAEHRIVIRCSALELRRDPGRIIADLLRLGVPRTPRPGERAS